MKNSLLIYTIVIALFLLGCKPVENEENRYQAYGPPFLLVDTKTGQTWKLTSSPDDNSWPHIWKRVPYEVSCFKGVSGVDPDKYKPCITLKLGE